MPFVEGESLRDRLNREKQLPVDEALRIAREAADALDSAHRHGVVHRDVKPENILLTEGHALMADFGIARSLAGESDKLTSTGLSVGTAAYMSPEQAAGERQLDGRSDVYSLATVLYEMLAGEIPFASASPQATLARRFTEAPPSVRAARDSVPESVDRAIQTALARTPADRFASAADFARALAAPQAVTASTASAAAATVATPSRGERITGSVRTTYRTGAQAVSRRPLFATLALGFVLGIGALFAWSRDDAANANAIPRIAVLPFENLGDSSDAYFADGVTDAVRGNLTELTALQVIARGSTEPYRRTTKTPTAIAQELGVRYLLTGTVRWAKQTDGTSRVQVSPELVEIGRGSAASKWQQRFDAPLTDVFKVQGEIAGQVAQALRVALSGSEKARIEEAPTSNPEAYDAYLRGQALWSGGANNSPAAIRQALAQFERAVELDPGFARAWAALASAAANLYRNSAPTPELAARSRAAAERTAALEPDSRYSRGALARYYLSVERDSRRALAEAEAAFRRTPGDASAEAFFAGMLRANGRWEESLTHSLAAYELDPQSPSRANSVADIYLWLRRPAEGLAAATRAVALTPRNPGAVQNLAMMHLSAGDLAAARRTIAQAAEIPAADLAVYMALYWDLGWVLDDSQQRLVLDADRAAFDGYGAAHGMVLAQLYDWRGDTALSRAWADTAQRYFADQLRDTPDDPQLHVLRAHALAYLGRFPEAIALGERGVALAPLEAVPNENPYYHHQLIRTYLLAGEREKALDRLEKLMSVPYFVSPAWLRLDPDFAPLRGDPRFERLASGRI